MKKIMFKIKISYIKIGLLILQMIKLINKINNMIHKNKKVVY